MDSDLVRKVLMSELRGYIQILEDRGISPPLSFEEAEKLPDSDLKRLMRETRDLARTPLAR